GIVSTNGGWANGLRDEGEIVEALDGDGRRDGARPHVLRRAGQRGAAAEHGSGARASRAGQDRAREGGAQQGRLPRQGDRARQSGDGGDARSDRDRQQVVGLKHALVFVALVAGCGSRPALDYGRALFSDATVSSAASNPFKCSTCHEIVPTAVKSLPG